MAFTKKVPRQPLKALREGELRIAKDGNTVKLFTRANGKIYEFAFITTELAPSSGGSGGTSSHDALSGLSDDDHLQYHNDTRGDTRYPLRSLLTTKGDLYARDTSAVNRLAVGSDGQILIPDSPSDVGMKWGGLIFNNDELVSNNDEIVTV